MRTDFIIHNNFVIILVGIFWGKNEEKWGNYKILYYVIIVIDYDIMDFILRKICSCIKFLLTEF